MSDLIKKLEAWRPKPGMSDDGADEMLDLLRPVIVAAEPMADESDTGELLLQSFKLQKAFADLRKKLDGRTEAQKWGDAVKSIDGKACRNKDDV